ncbi:MAG: hypothetical protein ACOCZW_04560 [Bacteroidota bacterium]
MSVLKRLLQTIDQASGSVLKSPQTIGAVLRVTAINGGEKRHLDDYYLSLGDVKRISTNFRNKAYKQETKIIQALKSLKLLVMIGGFFYQKVHIEVLTKSANGTLYQTGHSLTLTIQEIQTGLKEIEKLGI